MDDNNKKNIQEEINERLDSNEENINNLVKKNNLIEKQLAKIAELKIPDYSEAIETLTYEVRESRENDQSSQLLPLLRAINNKLDKAPKSAVKQLRILLFPEVNPGEYYKIVFGRLIPWLVCLLATTYLFLLGREWISAWGNYRYNKQSEQSVKAWIYMNEHSSKQVKKAMDTAWEKSEKE